eukprot:scaffold35955_cov45-Isochrysis_galbana.AAC.1
MCALGVARARVRYLRGGRGLVDGERGRPTYCGRLRCPPPTVLRLGLSVLSPLNDIVAGAAPRQL